MTKESSAEKNRALLPLAEQMAKSARLLREFNTQRDACRSSNKGRKQSTFEYPFEETIIGFDKGEVTLDEVMAEYRERLRLAREGRTHRS